MTIQEHATAIDVDFSKPAKHLAWLKLNVKGLCTKNGVSRLAAIDQLGHYEQRERVRRDL